MMKSNEGKENIKEWQESDYQQWRTVQVSMVGKVEKVVETLGLNLIDTEKGLSASLSWGRCPYFRILCVF